MDVQFIRRFSCQALVTLNGDMGFHRMDDIRRRRPFEDCLTAGCIYPGYLALPAGGRPEAKPIPFRFGCIASHRHPTGWSACADR